MASLVEEDARMDRDFARSVIARGLGAESEGGNSWGANKRCKLLDDINKETGNLRAEEKEKKKRKRERRGF